MIVKIDYLKNHNHNIYEVAKILHENFKHLSSCNLPIQLIRKELEKTMNINSFPIGLIAFDNEKILGTCCIDEFDDVDINFKPWLTNLVVDKNYRNLGIGTMLINFAIQKIKTLDFNKLYISISDPKLYYFYKKFGFIEMTKNYTFKNPESIMSLTL